MITRDCSKDGKLLKRGSTHLMTHLSHLYLISLRISETNPIDREDRKKSLGSTNRARLEGEGYDKRGGLGRLAPLLRSAANQMERIVEWA